MSCVVDLTNELDENIKERVIRSTQLCNTVTVHHSVQAAANQTVADILFRDISLVEGEECSVKFEFIGSDIATGLERVSCRKTKTIPMQ